MELQNAAQTQPQNAAQTQDNSRLASMRKGRERSAAIFMEFMTLRGRRPNFCFCFYEGKDDPLYYNSLIEAYLGSDYTFYHLEGKEKVLALMKKIRNVPEYNSTRAMFFVDRDFDAPQAPHPDLYETPGYSIENFYVGIVSFEKILRASFGLNTTDSAFSACADAYHETFRAFHDIMLPFYARVKYKHEVEPENKKCSFNDIKNTRLAQIAIGTASKSPDFDSEMEKIDAALQQPPDPVRLSEIEGDLRKAENPQMTYRGKNELFCFTQLLNQLRDDYNAKKEEQTVFSSMTLKNVRKVTLDAANNPLLTLKQFADTPEDLIDFIQAHEQ